jgi:Bacterial PH domain
VRSPEGNREVFRLAPPLILWWVWVAFAVANVADLAIEGASARFAIVVPAILVTITGLAYALALRPRVIAEPSGLTIVNPFRDHHVPWAAIQAVDTGDWVRVHCAPGEAAADPPGPAAASPPSSAASKAIACWALYVSARTKRRAARAGSMGAPGLARPAMPPRTRRVAGSGMLAVAGQEPGYAEDSRLPEEARYLASLPAAKAIAVRLDTRAGRERARARQADPGRAAPENVPVTARWAWPPAAAMALPALALLIAVLA